MRDTVGKWKGMKNWKRINLPIHVKIDIKICTKCKLPHPIEDYQKRSNTPDGRATECNDCIRQRAADIREKRRNENIIGFI